MVKISNIYELHKNRVYLRGLKRQTYECKNLHHKHFLTFTESAKKCKLCKITKNE